MRTRVFLIKNAWNPRTGILNVRLSAGFVALYVVLHVTIALVALLLHNATGLRGVLCVA